MSIEGEITIQYKGLENPQELVRAESRIYVHFQASDLELCFAIQARRRTWGPFPLRKGTAAVAFREFGNKCGVVAVNLLL
jgi:hypothetical protein